MALTDEEKQWANLMSTNAATQLMLRYLFEMQFSGANDPQKFRAEVTKQMLGLVDQAGLPPLKPEADARVRAQMKVMISALLSNEPTPAAKN